MKKRLLGIMLALSMLAGIVPVSGHSSVLPVEAASRTTKKKALQSYRKLLSKKTVKWSSDYYVPSSDIRFAVCDINKDGIKELILTYDAAPHMYGWNRIYTYSKGKAKSLGHFTSVLISKNKNYMEDGYSNCGISRATFYRLTRSGKRKILAQFYVADHLPYGVKGQIRKKYSQSDGMYWYYYSFKVNGKSTTYAKCMKTVNALRKKAKYVNLKYHTNTSLNRRKYIK